MSTTVQSDEIDKALKAYTIVGKLPEGTTYAGFFADEAVSSKIRFTKRPAAAAIMEAAKPGDMIIAAKFDRMFRSVGDLCETLEILGDRRIRLVLLDADIDTSTVNGQGLMKILAVIKWMEREAIRSRTKESLAYRRANGIPHCGPPPIGWKREVKLYKNHKVSRYVPYKHERFVAQRVHETMQSSKNMLEAGIALRKNGVVNPRALAEDKRYWSEFTMRNWSRAYLNNFPLPEGAEAAKFPEGSLPVGVHNNLLVETLLDLDGHEEPELLPGPVSSDDLLPKL
jgi:DNA invertase Pin-like site-specific DNA recombinase